LYRCNSRLANAYVIIRLRKNQHVLISAKGNQIGTAFWETISGEHGLDDAGLYVEIGDGV
jgi:hypothetical protein